MIKTAYIGFSDELINLLLNDDRYELCYVITCPGRLWSSTRETIKEKGIEFCEVSKKGDLYGAFENMECDLALIYKFGLIIPDEIVKSLEMYNIHWGDLRTNRGAHSLRWTILLNQKETKITLYQIDGVDEGVVVKEIGVPVDEFDDIISLELKMEQYLPELLSELYIYHYCNSKDRYNRIEDGIYRNKIQEQDYRIDMDVDNYNVILHKINCVKDFGGATIIINDKVYRAYDIDLVDNMDDTKNEDVIYKATENGKFMRIFYKEYIVK